MPDDILDPVPNPSPVPLVSRGPRKIVCQFCECELAVDGMVLKGSDKAKKLRKSEEEIEERERTIAILRQEITTLKAAREPGIAPVSSRSGLTF